ncbi:hypothetical protein [Dyadobacter sp. OTU695]|uniref:hypothetical protein n=1 Tax=Dyadobacter sp. OTU695 TaxID=3043860 RepID=UPI00313B63DA
MSTPDEAYTPDELLDYSDWHQTLDYIAWLFKTCYTTIDNIKKKKFNIHHIFVQYLSVNKIELKHIKKEFTSPHVKIKSITDDIKRGWYNELAFIYPLKASTLGVSFGDINENLQISTARFTFPSWKITEFYYSSYFYLRTIAQYKNPDFRIQEHKATLNSFKNNALDSFQKVAWKFPLDIAYKPKRKYFVAKTMVGYLKHLNHMYSYHPRTPNLSSPEITREIYKRFKKRGRRFKRPSHYTLFDFILEFRIWANYLDIDNLLTLYGSGFKAFLDQNLSLLLFFIGGITELVYIAVFGEIAYITELQNLYDLYAKNNNNIKDTFIYSSIYQRMKIFKIQGFISKEIQIESVINSNLIE